MNGIEEPQSYKPTLRYPAASEPGAQGIGKAPGGLAMVQLQQFRAGKAASGGVSPAD